CILFGACQLALEGLHVCFPVLAVLIGAATVCALKKEIDTLQKENTALKAKLGETNDDPADESTPVEN
ncbi:MAG: hypothetical protein VX438_09430, partial [Planctomycetota bacterium]|nr:hypothetical protein [Planctomycetota bacterium]